MRIDRELPRILLVLAAATLGLLSACKTTPPARPPAAVPAPALQLLEAKPLVIPDTCVASGSYFVEFTVQSDGRTARVAAPSTPACVHQALTTWVRSFRYAAPGTEVPTGIEWMLVTGRRGG